MRSGIGLSEILLIFALIIIFVKPKDIPELLRKSLKFIAELRAQVRKFLDDISKQ